MGHKWAAWIVVGKCGLVGSDCDSARWERRKREEGGEKGGKWDVEDVEWQWQWGWQFLTERRWWRDIVTSSNQGGWKLLHAV